MIWKVAVLSRKISPREVVTKWVGGYHGPCPTEVVVVRGPLCDLLSPPSCQRSRSRSRSKVVGWENGEGSTHRSASSDKFGQARPGRERANINKGICFPAYTQTGACQKQITIHTMEKSRVVASLGPRTPPAASRGVKSSGSPSPAFCSGSPSCCFSTRRPDPIPNAIVRCKGVLTLRAKISYFLRTVFFVVQVFSQNTSCNRFAML